MIANQSIKSIIFDLGGVILNIDTQKTINTFKKMGAGNFNEIYSRIKQNSLFDHFEKGSITVDEFRTALKKLIKNSVNSRDIDFAWNAMLQDLPLERLELLETLRNKYRLFLLSNTNEIHITAYLKILKNNYGLEDLSHLFEKEYYSHKIGLRKPDIEIFQYVLEENNLMPKETLFIDDSSLHVEGAKRAGIIALLLKEDETILDVFD